MGRDKGPIAEIGISRSEDETQELGRRLASVLREGDVVVQKTPFSFDVSVWEFFWPLLVGSKLAIAPPQSHRDPGQLVDLITELHVTTIHFVPSMLQVFLEAHNAGTCRSLKRVICSGEALSVDLNNKFYSIFDSELHNLYGPTEAGVDVTCWPCRKEETNATVPIGRPIVLSGRRNAPPRPKVMRTSRPALVETTLDAHE